MDEKDDLHKSTASTKTEEVGPQKRGSRTIGLSIPGSTAAAVNVGLGFEELVGGFDDYLRKTYGRRYTFEKSTRRLPKEIKTKLAQFFALCSQELQTRKPQDPCIGDIYREDSGQVMIFTHASKWKAAKEGIQPDRILHDTESNKVVLIEAKYGDTQGNAHIERAGARATVRFNHHIDSLFGGKAMYLHIFSGPMITARHAGSELQPKVAKRGEHQGEVVQSPEKRRFASARYQRQIEALFGDGEHGVLLWSGTGLPDLISMFEDKLKPWLNQGT